MVILTLMPCKENPLRLVNLDKGTISDFLTSSVVLKVNNSKLENLANREIGISVIVEVVTRLTVSFTVLCHCLFNNLNTLNSLHFICLTMTLTASGHGLFHP